MGKAIRNFKDALSGVEEAKFRRIEEENQNRPAASIAQQSQAQPQQSAPQQQAQPAPATVAAGTATDPSHSSSNA